MHFSRKEPRVSIACAGAIRPGRTDTSIGQVVDLSQHGVGVEIEKFTPPGTLVHIALDPGAFPDLAMQGRVPVISGLVVNCKRGATPRARYRAGVYVAQMPEWLRDHIRHHVVDAGDAQLHVVEAGAGPAIVMQHGFPDFWYVWRLQIRPLVEAGFRVILPDLRGFNLSSKPKPVSRYRPAVLAADLSRIVGHFGVREVTLVFLLQSAATGPQALSLALVSRFLMTAADAIGFVVGVAIGRGRPASVPDRTAES